MFRLNSILFTALFFLCTWQNVRENVTTYKAPIDAPTVDGPYVLYRNDSAFVKYIQDNSGILSVKEDSMSVKTRGNITLQVNTDIPGKTFTVKLKSKLTNEKPEYNGVKKMLVISDIEGNFEAFRKLLQVNGVIDENFNWTFDKGHLVLVGDFVDRGKMVMEVLWLIYSLEDKAKAAGGYVHYILGNHEIMNMSGDLGYVHERYILHALLMNEPYMQLFGPDAEIGRWLASKNIVERVGNTLFTHGGISSYMNNLQSPLKELNEITRPYYTDSTYEYKDVRLNVVYSDFGPFWYRGYYKTPKATQEQVDSTINFYGVKQITTGHTIIANQITSFFKGKVIDIDMLHAEGVSEALLMEDGKMWRVNKAGEKSPVISL